MAFFGAMSPIFRIKESLNLGFSRYRKIPLSIFRSDMKDKKAILYCDGASKGNPGHSGIGAVILINGNKTTLSSYIGLATNNIAEYTALLKGLEEVRKHDVAAIDIFTDSELLTRQVKGIYQVKSPNLLSLYKKVMLMLNGFKQYTINHIPRESNSEADRLANLGAKTRKVS